MMNEAWTWRPLGELFEIGAGKPMSAAARNGADKTPFLRTSNVFWDQIALSSVDEMSIPERELPAKLLRCGDLLVCEGGEIGGAAIWNGEIETMSFQNHLHRLRPIVQDVEPRFYVYFLQSAHRACSGLETRRNANPVHTRPAGRGSEGNRDRAGAGELAANNPWCFLVEHYKRDHSEVNFTRTITKKQASL